VEFIVVSYNRIKGAIVVKIFRDYLYGAFSRRPEEGVTPGVTRHDVRISVAVQISRDYAVPPPRGVLQPEAFRNVIKAGTVIPEYPYWRPFACKHKVGISIA